MSTARSFNLFRPLEEVELNEEYREWFYPTPELGEYREPAYGGGQWYVNHAENPSDYLARSLPPEGEWEVEPPPKEVHHLLPEDWQPFKSGEEYLLLTQEIDINLFHDLIEYPVKGGKPWAFRCGREGRILVLVSGRVVETGWARVPEYDPSIHAEEFCRKTVQNEYDELTFSLRTTLGEFLRKEGRPYFRQ